jgi:hypothetical protein
MSKIMRGRLAGSVLLGLALVVTTGASALRAENSPLAQETILASRNPSVGLGERHAFHHQMRRQRIVRRHFRGPRVIGVDGGAVAVPVPIQVPQESDEIYPPEPSFGGFGYRPFPPPPVVAPPQIITLPDLHPGARRVVPREAIPRAPIVHWRVAEVHRRAAKHRVIAYRIVAWPVAYVCWPYAGALVPIAFAPCDDPPHSAIYNTPCGVRPYE